MADTLQQESLPLSLRSRILAALAFSGETQIGALFRQMLKSDKHSVRWLGALGSGLIQDKKSVNELGLLLIYDNSVFVNRAASLALIVIDTNQSLELLTRALLEGNEEVRRAAAEGLARHPTEGFPVLREGAEVEDILVRRAVVYGLVRVNEPWAIELLEKMQLEDDQWVIRNAATQGLEDIKSISVSIPAPQPEIHETPWLLKFASEKGLGVSPGQGGWDILKAALTGGHEDQKLAAMDIYRLKPSEARNVISELYQLMNGPEGDVREAAYTTLWYLDAAGINLPTS
jgi:HEAT repeat protein